MSRAIYLAQFGFPNGDSGNQTQNDLSLSESPRRPASKSKVALALIATANYLPFARLTAQTFQNHHPKSAAYLLIVDGRDGDRSQFPEGTVFLLSDLALPDAGWYAAKYNATQFCNAIKPFFFEFLNNYSDNIVYLDTDIAVFGGFDAMLSKLQDHPIVLTPHLLAPFPRPEHFWVHPNNADIFHSGLMNAGCLGLNLRKSGHFLKLWHKMNFAPGAFYNAVGGQTDQQHLNWALVAAEGTYVLRDPAYNVAYWNLHERSLRSEVLDGGGERWSVNDRSLICFHFSGFSPANPLALSKHDNRYSIYNLPSVAEILDWYSAQLQKFDYLKASLRPYGFERLPNGFAMNELYREILKKYEAYAPRFDVSTAKGSDALCAFLMAPLPAAGSLLPLIAAEIYDSRPDLQAGFPHAHICPDIFWGWFCRHAGREYGVDFLVEHFRRVLISDSLVGFTEEVASFLTQTSREKFEFLGKDRRRAADVLENLGQESLAASLLEAENEWIYITDFSGLIKIYEQRDDLQRSFSNIFGEDHSSYLEWLQRHSFEEHALSPSAVARFEPKMWSTTLARIFSFLSRRDDLAVVAQHEMLSENPERLVRELIRGAGEGLEYDLDDVEIFLFLHRRERHVLVPLYLELPPMRRLEYSPRVPENKLIALPELVRSSTWARYGCELHGRFVSTLDGYIEDEIKKQHQALRLNSKSVLDYVRLERIASSPTHILNAAKRSAVARWQHYGREKGSRFDVPARSGVAGVNVFGFFYADTGVGESTRGLSRAVATVRPAREVPLFTGHLRDETAFESLLQRFDYDSDTNVIVSYPHQHEDFFGTLPIEYMEGRRNIIHLAWEQRDWHPYWRTVYDRYDEIWAISEFAAGPFRRLFGDRVRVVPNVLSVEEFPELGPNFIRPKGGDKFRFLFVFDANSSIERKNPEAVLNAFIAAFAGTSHQTDVELYFKVGSLERIEHSERVNALKKTAAGCGLTIHFDGRTLPRAELLSLVGSADCYVSLHRAEGFGYTLAEAMYYSVPVIASGYSGNLEFMDKECSFLIPCRETYVSIPDGPFQLGSVWGDPDHDAAVDAMRKVVLDQRFAKVVGTYGRERILRTLTAVAVGGRLRESLL